MRRLEINETMTNPTPTISVRKLNPSVFVIDTAGEVSATARAALNQAYAHATHDGAKSIVLNFSQLDYMNSTGIGVIVSLLADTRRSGQKLLAYGLSDHYRRIFELTRLDEAIGVYSDEATARAAAC